MQRLRHALRSGVFLGLDFAPLRRLVVVCFERYVQSWQIVEVGVCVAQREDVREGVRVRGIVGVDQDVAGAELRCVLKDGGFQLAELFEDECALLAAGQLDAVDRRTGLDGRVVGWGEGPGEEGVEEGGFAGAGAAEHVCEEDVALDGGALAAFAGLGQFEGGGGAGAGADGWGLEAEVGEVGEGGGGAEEGGHGPLREPALEGDVACFVGDGG